jgi:hypothetical protein
MFDTVTRDLDSRSAAADAISAHRVDALRVGAERLALAAHWCDLHPAEDDLPLVGLPGRWRPRRSGAGTPGVAEFAAEELGCLLGVHSHAAHNLMADAVNLRHRHPLLWERVMAAEVADWVARKTTHLVAAAGLSLGQARWVDEVTAGYAASLTPGRYLALVEARIIEADPAAAEARRKAHALHRFVRTGQTTEHGLRTLVARATAGEVIYLVAVVDRIAQILALQGDTDPADVRRSKALGVLATPARALQLLAWAEQEHPDDEQQSEPESAVASRNDPDLNAAIAAGLAAVPPAKLLPPATLHLHLSEAALVGGAGVARLEGVGPITLGQVREFLGHCHVTVKPVVDLAGGMPVDCYEIPARMHEIVTLRHPFEVFPWGTGSSRTADDDHTERYVPPDDGGPPGQTHPDNLGPLQRRHHRVKTHGPGWRHRQLAPGVFLWRTATGHWYRVDNHGTHHLGTHISLAEQHFAALLAA